MVAPETAAALAESPVVGELIKCFAETDDDGRQFVLDIARREASRVIKPD